ETDPTVMVDGPGPSLCFQNVEGRRYDNNRVHFDIEVADRNGEVERLREAGAETVRVLPTYTVMRDPEGNQFCLVDTAEALAA
ncbi:MAG: VOC family protein, partial [Pseudomonadota bacterium]|nr:VOC family protein [Pseudomonadota bacterium]